MTLYLFCSVFHALSATATVETKSYPVMILRVENEMFFCEKNRTIVA